MSSRQPSSDINHLTLISAAVSVACVGMTVYQTKQIRKLRKELNSLSSEVVVNEAEAAFEDAQMTSPIEKPKTEQDEPTDPNLKGRMDIMTVRAIGKVFSVYRLCVGTPRQGLLAPNSRGRILLDKKVLAPESLDQLQSYSHIWIVFVFHLNSNSEIFDASMKSSSPTLNSKKKKGKGGHRLFPAKIKPPALGGKKVGIFATRTPHRPNPIGFSLCKLEKVDIKSGCVYISGLDLVDGTPVLDIKPYVPHYDSVGYDPKSVSSTSHTSLPEWVSAGLQRRRPVYFSLRAERQLSSYIENDQLEFYGRKFEKCDDAFSNIRSCIEEVLSVDVRSAWQTGKARKGASQADRPLGISSEIVNETISKQKQISHRDEKSLCTQQLDNLLICFSVTEKKDQNESKTHLASKGSGCDDIVMVKSIEFISKGNQLADTTFDASDEAVYEEVWEALLESIQKVGTKDGKFDEITALNRVDVVAKSKGLNYDGKNSERKDTTKKLIATNEEQVDDKKSVTDSTQNSLDEESPNNDIHSNVMKTLEGKENKNESEELNGNKHEFKGNHSQDKKSGKVKLQRAPLQKPAPSTFTFTELYAKPDEKKDILVEPIVQDYVDYNKLKDYWKQAATKNTPTGLRCPGTKGSAGKIRPSSRPPPSGSYLNFKHESDSPDVPKNASTITN